jgi:hypothetical protein
MFRGVLQADGPYVKDGINNYVVLGQQAAVDPEKTGTKVAAHSAGPRLGGGHEQHDHGAAPEKKGRLTTPKLTARDSSWTGSQLLQILSNIQTKEKKP